MISDPATIRRTALDLLASRAAGATICPSEVARAVAATDEVGPSAWRDAMPAVHDAVDALREEGIVGLSWQGRPLPTRSGPYRIRLIPKP